MANRKKRSLQTKTNNRGKEKYHKMTASRNRNNDIPRNYEEILEDFLAEKEEIKEKLLREVMRYEMGKLTYN